MAKRAIPSHKDPTVSQPTTHPTHPDAMAHLPPMARLLAVVARLRDPNGGCPWDLKQTHTTLRKYLLEEAYEAVEAIDSGDPALLKDELGDVLLQVALHAQLASEQGTFDFDAVCTNLADKLVRRHPHVFGEATAHDADAVVQNWQAIKAAEKGADAQAPTSVLDGVSLSQPALSRALEVSTKAVAVGFEWPSFESLWACVMSEFDELRAELNRPALNSPEAATAAQSAIEDELGDILFASVNLARQLKVHPEVALTRATHKFTQRFQTMERLAQARGTPLDTLDFDTWDALWRDAKAATKI
jgi:ATP diphosphatase